MRFKKLIGALLAVALVVGLIPAASAAGSATVSLSSGTVKAGDSVTLTVSIKNNPGLAAWMLYFYYDTDVFTVDPDTDMKAGGKFASSGTLLGNTIAVAKETGRYNGPVGKDGAIAGWFSTSDVTGDGAVMTITFHVAKGAPNGTYSIGLAVQDSVTNAKAEKVALTAVGSTITVTGGSAGGGLSTVETPEFSDVSGHWAYDYIMGAAELGLMQGTGGTEFNPDRSLTRAEFVTVLWRALGEPKAGKAATFTDIDPKQTWYHAALAWAQENDIIKGTGDGTTFSPTDIINREQVALILYRLAGGISGMEMMFTPIYDVQYTDSGSIHDWAKAGVYWAIYNEIYCGTTSVEIPADTLAPLDDATRAQIAVMMVRYLENQGGI